MRLGPAGPRSDAGKRHSNSYTSKEAKGWRGKYVSTFDGTWKINVIGLLVMRSNARQRDLCFGQYKGRWWGSTDFSVFLRVTACRRNVTPILPSFDWQRKYWRICKLVSSILRENILFGQVFPIQIMKKLAFINMTLNKHEFIVVTSLGLLATHNDNNIASQLHVHVWI
jgi:hypothetical protein